MCSHFLWDMTTQLQGYCTFEPLRTSLASNDLFIHLRLLESPSPAIYPCENSSATCHGHACSRRRHETYRKATARGRQVLPRGREQTFTPFLHGRLLFMTPTGISRTHFNSSSVHRMHVT